MNTLNNIWTIARFESRILLRSWFFRIFALIGIIVIVSFNMAMLFAANARWGVFSLSSALPYLNISFFNFAQAVIIAFLSTEFMKRDKKLDTSEVIYIRSMSNGEYVLGKSLGTLLIFFLLNLIIVTLTAIVELAAEGATFDWEVLLVYPAIISLPTLIFMLGLAYILMIVLKNQAVTFVILLGLIGFVSFEGFDNYNYAMNFIGILFPMLKSEMSGFANFSSILEQRLIYLLWGIGLIFLTVTLITRLEQSRAITIFSWIVAVTSLLTGSWLFTNRILESKEEITFRQELRLADQKFIGKSNADIDQMKITLDHLGHEIKMSTEIDLVNKSGKRLDSLWLRLNPGLEVNRLSWAGQEREFKREGAFISWASDFEKQDTGSLTVDYTGSIDERAMYLDIDEEDRSISYVVTAYAIQKKYAYLEPDYVLLTEEANWYPVTRVPFSKEAGRMSPLQFIEFELQVNTINNLLPVSQGPREELEEGKYHFKPENRLPKVSLAIGDYIELSRQVDSVEYKVIFDKKHDYFKEHFNALSDTLDYLIRDIKNDFEADLNLSYPLPRYSMVEVPAHFVSYPRLHTIAREVMQPEMSFIPEKGFVLISADFRYRRERIEDRNERNSGEQSEIEIQSSLFKAFIQSTVTSGYEGWSLTNDDSDIFVESFSAFPNYYSFTNFVSTDSWEFFNKSLESYLWGKVKPSNGKRWWQAMSPEDDANIALQEKSFNRIVEEEERELVDQVIQSKGNFLFTLLQERTGDEAFRKGMADFISSNRFEISGLQDLEKSFSLNDSIKVAALLNSVLNTEELPGFLVSEPEIVSFVDGNRTRYNVNLRITNTKGVEGLVEISYSEGRDGGGRRSRFGGRNDDNQDNAVKNIVALAPFETREISAVLDNEVNSLKINTLISANLPNLIEYRLNEPEVIKGSRTEYNKIVDQPVQLSFPEEFIVDNESEGFNFSKGEAETPLRSYIRGLGQEEEESDKYVALNWWRAPLEWQATVSTWSYGEEVRSAHFIRSGDGSQKAYWKADIKEEGLYDIYVYINDRINSMGRRDNNDDKYHYIVHSDDGTDEISVDLSNAEKGWNRLGSYYISPENAKLEITNKSTGRTIVADAAKWVKR